MDVIGIDPGLSGALAMYNENGLQDVYEIPTAKSTGRGREVLWAELNEQWNYRFLFAEHTFLEKVMSRPGEGVSSAFKFGLVYGGLIGMNTAKKIPLTMVTPGVWMKEMGVGRGSKEASVIRAEQLFPGHSGLFRGPKGGKKDGAAEAALISKYGYDKLNK
jgi:crossover junction endodeoxyribonuclease RuvC